MHLSPKRWDAVSERAIGRPWHGISEGYEFGTGIPAEDLVTMSMLQEDTARGRAMMSSVYLENQGAHASGVLLRLTFSPDSGVRRRASAPLVLSTARHVLPDRGSVDTTRVYARYVGGVPRQELRVDPDVYVQAFGRADAVACGVQARSIPASLVSHVGVTRVAFAKAGEEVFVVSHPNAAAQSLSTGTVLKVDCARDVFVHDADTLPGSSGAGIFNRDWALVGLHVAGGDVRTSDGRVHAINHGVCIHHVLDKLRLLGWHVESSGSDAR
jgi:hypothetical protein